MSSNDENNEDDRMGGVQTITRPKSVTKKPSMYKVILLNDDFTPMDFVTHILQKFFQKMSTDADRIMMQVHHQGSGIAGVYSYEIAETKAAQTNEYAKSQKYPLKCIIEKD